MTPVFLHGWALDASLWDAVRAQLGGVALDRGYFGAVRGELPSGPLLLVGHSLGALLWLTCLPADVQGLVAINGFDRFAAGEDWPGVPGRVLARMADRLARAPGEVVTAFRARCGIAEPAPARLEIERLREDLAILATADVREAASTLQLPMLILQGSDDPILPAGLRTCAFAGVPARERQTRIGGGHLLPLTDSGWCGQAITRFAGTLR